MAKLIETYTLTSKVYEEVMDFFDEQRDILEDAGFKITEINLSTLNDWNDDGEIDGGLYTISLSGSKEYEIAS